MAKRVPGSGRRELVDRWRAIESEDDREPSDSASVLRIKKKEEWFSDTLKFLVSLPKETHVWCECWDLMTPLLETFNNYFGDTRHNSPLKVLWTRICRELRACTQCVFQHHQAHNTYHSEYESDAVGPLLHVLKRLDEERVTEHLREINSVVTCKDYHPDGNNVEVVSVLFEVLMYPSLLEGQSLMNEFQIFIEAVDNSHELELAGHQQYPGVYALLFLKSVRARAIGYRLAGTMGKLRNAADLDPLQFMLKKCIDFLETEALPSNHEASRPRIQLERLSAWIGIKSLLGFLEPSAFEEGILERHPIFVSIVLNHVCDDTSEFTYAVNCLRLLFEVLGYKLWLRTTISPTVMRNTLLGQCFRTKNEKSHKEIYDTFQPFLQSLEPLEDGEHEKQRRHFIYFLLHQVTHSSNFSMLTKKLARKMALLIIRRGYLLNHPCPPYECAHMWGPSLVSSFKDSSLHNSLRVPAFDLIYTIVISDAAALMHIKLKNNASLVTDLGFSNLVDDDDESHLFVDVENDCSCWGEFSEQSKLISRECNEWMCVPLLWVDALIAVDPSTFPLALSKALFWSLSRVSLLEPLTSAEMELSLNDWLSTYAKELSCYLVWQVLSGCDDGGDGNWSENSVKASAVPSSLIKTLKRCAAYFVIQMGQFGFWKQWSWEPLMAESLMLLLIDANDDVRQVAKQILENVSNSRGLTPGLRFLCSNVPSLSATFLGLRYAFMLVQLDSSASNFCGLQHLFFMTQKLFKEVGASEKLSIFVADEAKPARFSSDGGFLVQPCFDKSYTAPSQKQSDMVDEELWSRYCLLLSERIWPSMVKCLIVGKTCLEHKASQVQVLMSSVTMQMACVRLLELFPVVFVRLISPAFRQSWKSKVGTLDIFDRTWFFDLVEWGKASNAILIRHWKQCVHSLLCLLRDSCSNDSKYLVDSIEKLILPGMPTLDDLKVKVAVLFDEVSRDDAYIFETKPLERPCEYSKRLGDGADILHSGTRNDAKPVFSEDPDVVILDAWGSSRTPERKVAVILDEEKEKPVIDNAVQSNRSLNQQILCKNTKVLSTQFTDKNSPKPLDITEDAALNCRSQKLDHIASLKDLISSKEGADKSHMPASSRVSNLGNLCTFSLANTEEMKGDANKITSSFNDEGTSNQGAKVNNTTPASLLVKSSASVPKRHVNQVNMPTSKTNIFGRQLATVRRFKPPRLDGWYKPILEIDYFSIVGLSPATVDDNATLTDFQKVPICFSSLEHYEKIFRPLILEELRAQLLNNFLEVSSPEEMSCGSLSIMSIERIDDFHLIRCKSDEREASLSRGCVENDLVLLTQQRLQHSAQSLHVLGKVERREKDNKNNSVILVIRFYLLTGSSRINKVKKLLVERSKWYVSHIMSITPHLREFQALSSLKDIPMLPIILNPVECSKSLTKCKNANLNSLPLPLQQTLKESFNNSQLQAVGAVIGKNGTKGSFELSLIQGPPGTGKTRTILAIVSALLSFSSPREDSLKEGHATKDLSTSRAKVSQSVAIARAWQDAALAKQLSKEETSSGLKKISDLRKRVLICAQSNAAVDELVSRISTCGLYGSNGKMFKPYLVRVGNVKTVHPSSLPYFIDTLVEQRLADEKMEYRVGKNDEPEDSLTTLRSKLEKLVEKIRFFEAKRASLRDKDCGLGNSTEALISDKQHVQEMSDAAIEANLKILYSKKKAVCIQLASAQACKKKSTEEIRALKHKIRKTILREAEIVVSTLSGSGGDVYGACYESISNEKFGSEGSLFDAVVIDEAAQALEPATLIPLQLLKSNGTKCIMVGDPKQLPATVLSSIASKFLYECSMFERLQRAGHPVVMLTEQYRMHPEICLFPSVHFYENKLLNGVSMTSKEALFHKDAHFRPYVFYDIMDGYEQRGKNSNSPSLYNEAEVDAAIELVMVFSKKYPSEFVGGRIGIITPYRRQLSLLRSRFASAFASSALDIEFNTVDGFQGREVDILILSTVRALDANGKVREFHLGNVGFVADVRRMNVALTRAKFSLWIVGNARTLQTNSNWEALLKNARERNVILSIRRPYGSFFTERTKKGSLLSKASGDNVSKARMIGRLPRLEAKQARRSEYNLKEHERHASARVGRQPEGNLCDSVDGLDRLPVFASASEGSMASKLNNPSEPEKIRKDLCSSRSSKLSGERSEPSLGILHEAHGREELHRRHNASNLCEKSENLIGTRKRQREAVDALLSSAVMSSKRPQSVSIHTEPKEQTFSSKPGALVLTELNKDCSAVLESRAGTGADTVQADATRANRDSSLHEVGRGRKENPHNNPLDGRKR